MQFLDNELNVLETYTYNLSLYMIHPTNIKNREKNIPNNAVLIASNIKDARYNITSMEQSVAMGHNKVRATFGNLFTFEINEPNGATLLSTIVTAARSLNIEDHKEAFYIVVLEFFGRDAHDNPKKFQKTFYYIVRISTFAMTTTAGGTVYSVTSTEASTQGYSYLEGVVKGQLTIEASTVGEFLDEINAKLNQDLINRVAINDSQLYADVYKFQFAKNTQKWLNWKFQALNDPINQSGYNIIGTGADRKLQITIGAGSAFADIFGMVLALTSEYKRVVAHDSGFMKATPNGVAEKKMDSFPVLYKIFSTVEPKRFDPIRGAYQKEITFTLQKYILPSAIIDPPSYTSSISTKDIQLKRVKTLNDIGLLRKKYEYLFTGHNTEIIDLDLKFDFAYYSAASYGAGWFGDANVQSTKEGKQTANMMSRLREAKQNYISATSDVANATDKLASSSKAVASATRNNIDNGLISTLNLNVRIDTGNLATFTNIQGSAKSILDSQISNYSNNFNTENVPHRVHFEADVQDASDSAGPENDLNGGAFQFGIIKSNIENTADMATIEINVRGDPYWLGLPLTYDTVNTGGIGLADFTTGSNFLYLKSFLPPTPETDSNGLRKPSVNFQMSGLYSITHVISNYRSGLFTQYLSGVLDTGTNIVTTIDMLDTSSITTDISGRVGANLVNQTSQLNIQETARKEIAKVLNSNVR